MSKFRPTRLHVSFSDLPAPPYVCTPIGLRVFQMHTHTCTCKVHTQCYSAAHDVQVEIKCKDGTHALNLVWPTEVNPDAVEAKFRKKSGHLVLSAPVID